MSPFGSSLGRKVGYKEIDKSLPLQTIYYLLNLYIHRGLYKHHKPPAITAPKEKVTYKIATPQLPSKRWENCRLKKTPLSYKVILQKDPAGSAQW